MSPVSNQQAVNVTTEMPQERSTGTTGLARHGRFTLALVAAVSVMSLVSASGAYAADTPVPGRSSSILSCPQGFSRPLDTFGQFIASGVNIRTGPGADCTSLGHGQVGQRATYHCQVIGHDGYLWTHLTNNATGVSGWVRENFLSGNPPGSPYGC